MKLNCIIDTCTCIYLSNAEFRQKSLLKHLAQRTNISYTNEILQELRDHRNKGLDEFILDKKYKAGTQKYSLPEYERRLYGSTMVSRAPGGNKGEIDNFALSIDQLHHLKMSSAVFITDDDNAINGNLSKWIKAFPSIQVWSSYEVILYLLAEKIIPSADIANDMIQEIIAIKTAGITVKSQKTSEKYIKIRTDYHNRINDVSHIIN